VAALQAALPISVVGKSLATAHESTLCGLRAACAASGAKPSQVGWRSADILGSCADARALHAWQRNRRRFLPMNSLNILKAVFRSAMLSLFVATGAHAADAGSQAEAEAMVKKAVALIKASGPEKAYDEISNGKAFKDRDLYVFVNDLNGKSLAHGANPKLIGKDLSGLKDSDGKGTTKLLIDIAKDKGHGWSEEFKFMNPATQKMQTKVVYVERVGDTFVACGVYKG
jgi:cytochrome c